MSRVSFTWNLVATGVDAIYLGSRHATVVCNIIELNISWPELRQTLAYPRQAAGKLFLAKNAFPKAGDLLRHGGLLVGPCCTLRGR